MYLIIVSNIHPICGMEQFIEALPRITKWHSDHDVNIVVELPKQGQRYRILYRPYIAASINKEGMLGGPKVVEVKKSIVSQDKMELFCQQFEGLSKAIDTYERGQVATDIYGLSRLVNTTLPNAWVDLYNVIDDYVKEYFSEFHMPHIPKSRTEARPLAYYCADPLSLPAVLKVHEQMQTTPSRTQLKTIAAFLTFKKNGTETVDIQYRMGITGREKKVKVWSGFTQPEKEALAWQYTYNNNMFKIIKTPQVSGAVQSGPFVKVKEAFVAGIGKAIEKVEEDLNELPDQSLRGEKVITFDAAHRWVPLYNGMRTLIKESYNSTSDILPEVPYSEQIPKGENIPLPVTRAQVNFDAQDVFQTYLDSHNIFPAMHAAVKRSSLFSSVSDYASSVRERLRHNWSRLTKQSWWNWYTAGVATVTGIGVGAAAYSYYKSRASK
jgi:hypothetical protein